MNSVLKISNYTSSDLEIDHFEICRGESWCIIGANTSAISNFVELFHANQADNDTLVCSPKTALISFVKQQEMFEEELRNDNTDFLDRIDPGTPARKYIENIDQYTEIIEKFSFQECLDKGYRQLSSGENRKLLLISALSENPELIIIENPYDGLDMAGCRELDAIFAILADLSQPILFTVNNTSDIPPWCTHLGVMVKNRLQYQGVLSEILSLATQVMEQTTGATFRFDIFNKKTSAEKELIHLKNGFARYGEKVIFSGVMLRVMSGQHTLITGPNGSGKSTLLEIITGDNQNCYANDLYIFGTKRGSGESIWELKKKMGIVTPNLHRNYYIPGSALQVVLSGFFDTIGVYTQFSNSQKQKALYWLEMIGLADQCQIAFRKLSYASQRLCLIARSLIKTPALLILDEPTQGLDQQNRRNLLNFLELIAQEKICTVLYASHRDDEFRSFFKQHLHLGK